MYINRAIESKLLILRNHFPALSVIGSRQVGKTTLVREIMDKLNCESIYLDLENPMDNAVFDHPLEFIHSVRDKVLIIDEIQRRPELFPILRSVIDSYRKNGRFILLGSATKDLLLMSNETLAGRIAYLELTPFFLGEIDKISDFRIHWLRGGYPLAYLENDDFIRTEWLKSFLLNYIERDLKMLGLSSSPTDVQRLLYMQVSLHGSQLNYNNLSNSIGLSAPTVKNIISFFEKSFIIRILQPFYTNINKRLVKTPKLYFRDSGIINYLLGIKNYESLLLHPMLGFLWEGYVIENIINTLGDHYQYYYYRTADGAECDLVVMDGPTCYAVIDSKFAMAPKNTKSMTITIQDIKPQLAFFVVPDTKFPYKITNNIKIATLEQTISILKDRPAKR